MRSRAKPLPFQEYLVLVELDLEIEECPLPLLVGRLFEEVDQRIEAFFLRRRDEPILSFVPSDFPMVYRALQYIMDSQLCTGNSFCEWGSGFGVVSLLAAELGFDACGIEIEDELHQESLRLASEFELEAEFIHGTFVPTGGQRFLDHLDEISWLRADGYDAYADLGLDIDDFDLVFAYPWPGEEGFIDNLFDYYASAGSLLLSYHGVEEIRLQRKK